MASSSRIGGRSLAALLPDLRTQRGPVYAALCDAITALVLDGRIATETRLPSERELAAALQLSRATVTAAYDALRTAGFPDQPHRLGQLRDACRPARGPARRSRAGARRRRRRRDRPVLRRARRRRPACCQDALRRGRRRARPATPRARATSRPGCRCCAQRSPTGSPPAASPTGRDQILVSNGAMHAFDLLLRLLIGPGDRVLTELPTYPGAIDARPRASARASCRCRWHPAAAGTSPRCGPRCARPRRGSPT